MKEINDIVKEYGEEFFTNDFLLSGDETWDLEALAWFDEKYPELSDEQRSEFSVQLDILFKECCTQALEQYRAEQEKIKNAPSPIVFEGLTLHYSEIQGIRFYRGKKASHNLPRNKRKETINIKTI